MLKAACNVQLTDTKKKRTSHLQSAKMTDCKELIPSDNRLITHVPALYMSYVTCIM